MHPFIAWLTSFFTFFTLLRSANPVLIVDLQMAPAVELPIDGLSYRGFAQMLYDVLDELGVPTEQIEYVCWGEPGPNGL
jgi:hypothetical protein